jgi:predicted dienelactone hydrolase
MLPVEVALVLVVLFGAVYPLLDRVPAQPLRLFGAVAAVTVLVAQVVLVGPHWQILPAYGGMLLVALALWWRGLHRRRRPVAAVASFLCLLTLGALWVLPMFSLPKPTGTFAVGTTGALNWTDSSRSARGDSIADGPRRELALQIWDPVAPGSRGDLARYARRKELSLGKSYLAAIRTNSLLNAPLATDGGPYPVLIFGHRWGGTRTQDTFLAEDLASHGYVVVAVDHPLNAARVQMSDGTVVRSDRADALSNLEATTSAAILALWGKELDIWVADNEFVLDKLQQNNAGWFNGRLDFNRVGAFGHSFGGAASTAMLGRDPRVRCAVNLDGWTFQGLDRRTTEPILLVYEGGLVVPEPVRGPETGVEGELDRADWAAIDGSLQRFGGLRAYVAGTQHLDFTDQTLVSPLHRITFAGPIKGARIQEITRGLVLGFFDRNLRAQGDLPAFPEVKLERWLGILPPP